MLELAVLADDLTGGMIIASMLEEAGVVCPLVTDAAHLDSLPADITAVVLARKIRLIPAEAAREEARIAAAAFARLGARTIYQKYSGLFDSTDRGNIGPIAEALMEATGAARTVFSPVYVERTLTLYKGHMFAGPMLISDTSKRFDPVTPSTTSDIVAKLRGQTQWKVGLIDHQMLGSDTLAGHLDARADCPFWVVDSVDEADVSKVAALTRGWPLVTGADSLAPAIIRDRLAGAPPQAGSGRRLLPPTPGFEAVLAGSCGEATLEQLAVFEADHPVWRVDLARDGDTPGLADAITAWAAERLKDGPVAVSTSATPEGVAAAQAAFGREGASARADQMLGAVAVRLRALGVRKFVVAGGETSGEVLKALDARRLEVVAYDDELFGGYCHSREGEAISLVLKPGGMGGRQFFAQAFERMRAAQQAGGAE